jgi:hypothetical protein
MIRATNVIAWTWLPSYPRISKASGDTVGCRALAEQPWYSRLGTADQNRPSTSANHSAKLLREYIGYWNWTTIRGPNGTGTERHATAVVGSYLRPRPLYTTTQLRRRLEKLVYYMRVRLDFLGTSASPALPSLAHVGVFRRRSRCEGKHAMLTILPRRAQHWIFDFPVLSEEVRECAMGDDEHLIR